MWTHDAQVVSLEATAQTLGAAGDSVKLVVLNARFMQPLAAALMTHVDCVDGMTGMIHDEAARCLRSDPPSYRDR